MTFGGADLHSHSVYSDGRDTPASLVRKAVEAGLSVLALSDHDAVLGVAEFDRCCLGTGLIPVPSVELSSRFGNDDVHVLGLFVDPFEESLVEKLATFRRDRLRRGEAMVERLRALGYVVELDEIQRVVGSGSFGRPHLARAMVDRRYVSTEDEAFERFLKRGAPAWVPKPKWKLADAIAAVQRAGGLAIVAHPVLYDDPDEVIKTGKEMGADGLEAVHADHDQAAVSRFRAQAERYGLLVSAGSDCHGSRDGRRRVGECRLARGEWDRLVAAALDRRKAAARPPIDLGPR